jgi:MFS family permease
MFFFLTQYLQGVSGYSPLGAGVAFLPMTLVLFAMTQITSRLTERVGGATLLAAGLVVGLAGMVWLSRLSDATAYFPGIAIPLLLLGLGMGTALTPLTTAGIAGVAPSDAGAASGLVNVAQQVGGALGIAIMVTRFTAASGGGTSPHALADGISAALTGSAALLAIGLAVVLALVRTPAPAPAPVAAPAVVEAA